MIMINSCNDSEDDKICNDNKDLMNEIDENDSLMENVV